MASPHWCRCGAHGGGRRLQPGGPGGHPLLRRLRGRQHQRLVQVGRHLGGRGRRLQRAAPVPGEQRERPPVRRLHQLDGLPGAGPGQAAELRLRRRGRPAGPGQRLHEVLPAGAAAGQPGPAAGGQRQLGHRDRVDVSRTVATGTWYTLAIEANGSTIRGHRRRRPGGPGQQLDGGRRPHRAPDRCTATASFDDVAVTDSATTPPTTTHPRGRRPSTTTSRPPTTSAPPPSTGLADADAATRRSTTARSR